MSSQLDAAQIKRLSAHYLALAQLVLRQLSDAGAVIARAEGGSAYEDPVATHHLVDWTLTCRGDSIAGIRHRALGWMAEHNSLPKDPFALDSYLSSGIRKPELETIADALASEQLPNGLLSFYTAYLHGGDHFSTLWGLKILLQFEDRYKKTVLAAARQCASDVEIFLRSPSHAGYLLLMLDEIHHRYDGFGETLRTVRQFLHNTQDDATGMWQNDPLTTAYVALDLLAQHDPVDADITSATRALSGMFDLASEATRIPTPIAAYHESATDSAFLQMLLRSFIAVNRWMHNCELADPSIELANTLVGAAPALMNAVSHLQDHTKKLELQLEESRRLPRMYRKQIDSFLETSPYESNVLIMMTFGFKDADVGKYYKELLDVIRKTLERRGLSGFLVTDRQCDPTLFGNLQVYLASCRAGIAVFDNFQPERAYNPNVAMEAGFLMAQGKPVAILKDKSLARLPSDWAGHLYIEFVQGHLRKVGPALEQWLEHNELGGAD